MAKRIPEDFVAALLQRIDIAEVVGGYVSLKKQGRNLLGLCPFHNEKTPSFSVSPDKQIFYCFGCHKGGNALRFLMEIDGLSFPDAVARAASMVGMELPQEDMSPEEAAAIKRRRRYFRLLESASAIYQQALGQKSAAAAQDYLRRRGVSPALAARFGLGFAAGWEGAARPLLEQGFQLAELEEAGLASRSSGAGGSGYFDKFHHRLIFPILDYRGQTVAFGGRILEEGQPKYLNSPETAYFHKSQNLYGLYQAAAAIRQWDEAVLMEGYMDVLSAHQFGVNNAVASLGTAFNTEHARLLKRYTTRVLLAYDGDSAGLAAADKAADILHGAGFTVRLLAIPEGQDPDDYLKRFGKAGWDKLAETAADFWQYRLNKALREHQPDSVAGKVAVMQQLRPYLNACGDAIELESVVNLLAQAIGVAPQTVYAELRPRTRVEALRQAPRQPARQSAPAGGERVDRIQANLLLFMLCDRAIFERVLTELGENFVESAVLQELLTLVQNNKEKYDWQPATLFSYLEEGAAYQLLLRMVQADFDREQMPALAEGCISALRIRRLQGQIAAKREELAKLGARPAEAAAALQEIASLERQIRSLRSGDNKL